MNALPFDDNFDLIISRGAFFFLTPGIIKESYRALKPGSIALLGGGYGALTPEAEIRKIAEESKDLNYKLGKAWISKNELLEMAETAGIAGSSHIIEEGGLWLLVQKH
jgi:SAM-dependent methyltransferase